MPDRAPAPARWSESAVTPSPPRGRARVRHLWQGSAREITSRWDILAVIAVGGALGSLARWGLAAAVTHPAGGFPWATFIANVTGCLLIGALMVAVSDVWPPSRYLRPFLGIGVLGGYTTFSTYMLDARTLLVTGHAATAGAYLASSLAAGLAAVWAGVVAMRSVVRLARRRARRKAGTKHRGSDRPASQHAPASTSQPPRSLL